LLTNFQKKVVDIIKQNVEGLSVSAPTSAGKSFVYLKVLLDLITKDRGTTVIYVVPTRALIKQVMDDFLENINQLGLEDIYVGCTSEIEALTMHPNNSNILVLTQERLYQLCTNIDIKEVNTKVIVIDEAHNIQNGARGILLENSLKFARTLWKDAKILFSSPMVKNPEKLLETFHLKDGLEEKDDFPLVRQNLINVKIQDEHLLISTTYANEEITIGSKDYRSFGNHVPEVLAMAALYLWNNQTSIVYSNEPLMSTDVARLLYNSGSFPRLYNNQLEEFADFIEEYIIDGFELATFIRCGLAFHFGALPTIIRSGIEELFKAGALKIVSCTSTLLEGINMPAKNIFVYKPEKGSSISSLDFWNLAGRAGRMGNDFVGNIICIEIDKWDNNPIIGDKYQNITPSSENKLLNEPIRFKEYIEDKYRLPTKEDSNEQLFSLIIKDHLLGEQLVNSHYRKENNIEVLREIDEITKNTIAEFKPPIELLKKSPGIMPERINHLWEFFFVNQNDYMELMPAYPLSENGYDRLHLIVKIINHCFMGDYWSEDFEKKITTSGNKWMKGTPLSQMIFYRSSTIVNKSGRDITKQVKKEIDFINNTLRYKIVKYTQTYVEVLKVFLTSIGKEQEAEKVINISAYLEYGACKASALEFMAMGLPREAATRLSDIIPNHEDITSDYCKEWLRRLDVEALNIASYLKKQINDLKVVL
jgi:replicative superfamily II helicase